LTQPSTIVLTADAADAKIKKLEGLIATCTRNMLELTQLSTYTLLGSPTFDGLTGSTRKQCEAVLPPFEELFGMLSLMSSQVAEAKSILSSLGRIGRDAKLTEITALLESVKLPPVNVPLEKRGLLTAAEVSNSVAPERLLEAMTKSFDEARELVFKIKAVWGPLNERVTVLKGDLKALKEEAEQLGVPVSELAQAEQSLNTVAGSVLSDPLSAAGDFEANVLPVIESTRTRLAQLKALKQQVAGQMAEAEQALAHLKTTHERSLQSVQERKDKVSIEHEDQLTMPLDDKVIPQLEAWLTRLKTTVADGKYQAASVGLVNWQAQVLNRTSSAESAFQANDALVRERRDMRGLMEALKIRAVAEGLAEDPEVTRLFAAATKLLYTRPTAMSEARALVKQYQDKILG
jgi:hypothetical protein